MGIGLSQAELAVAASVREWAEARCGREVIRGSLSDDAAAVPPFWPELVELGWPGIAVSTELGGGSLELGQVAVLLEEAGRRLIPGPLLPTIWASLVLREAAPSQRTEELLRGLMSGSLIGAVGLDVGKMCGRPVEAMLELEGCSGPILGSPAADFLILPVDAEGTERWCLVNTSAVSVRRLSALDPTRALGEVRAEPGQRVRAAVLRSVTRERITELGAILISAELTGLAQWALDTATDHARERRQFGRPIGQFQAVKHRCADMMLMTEQARAATWEASHGNGSSPARSFSIAAAATLSIKAGLRCTEDCIQVLGGVGFTWEHDAHLYLRRALAVSLLLGGARAWRLRTAELAVGGMRPVMRIELGPEASDRRSELRGLLRRLSDLDQGGQREGLTAAGLVAPHLQPPWGRGAGPAELMVIAEEMERAGIRPPSLGIGAWIVDTLIAHGTAAQQRRWVEPTLKGKIRWCQLFSEPGAGSDLASLTARARRDGDEFVLSGQKVWTSKAREADFGICLARTERAADRHHGITAFVVGMDSPGIEVRPLRDITGNTLFNEVFLDEVRVPEDQILGEVGGGWTVAKATMASERLHMGSIGFGRGLEQLLEVVCSGPGRSDQVVLDRLGALLADGHSMSAMELRRQLRSLAGAAPGPESSLRKLLAAFTQGVYELGLELQGPRGAAMEGDQGVWAEWFLGSRGITIGGGTSEIQRNVVAERFLGLPRDPEPGT